MFVQQQAGSDLAQALQQSQNEREMAQIIGNVRDLEKAQFGLQSAINSPQTIRTTTEHIMEIIEQEKETILIMSNDDCSLEEMVASILGSRERGSITPLIPGQSTLYYLYRKQLTQAIEAYLDELDEQGL